MPPLPLPGLPQAHLVTPAAEYLDSYCDALRRGWSADNVRGRVAAEEELALLQTQPADYFARSDDRVGLGLIALPDGSQAQRLPWMRRWIWDGEACGSINLRWQPGTGELPPHVLGHIGYAVVPWKRRQGLATAALAAMLIEARALGLPFVDLTTDEDNLPSQAVIVRNGGLQVERFTKPAAYGALPSLRWRISL